MKDSAPKHPDYKKPKKWDGKKKRNPNGKGAGFPDKNGDVWIPTNHDGTHRPHWDVQGRGGKHRNVYPAPGTYPATYSVDGASDLEKLGWGAIGLGVGIIVFDVLTVPSGEGLIGVAILTGTAAK